MVLRVSLLTGEEVEGLLTYVRSSRNGVVSACIVGDVGWQCVRGVRCFNFQHRSWVYRWFEPAFGVFVVLTSASVDQHTAVATEGVRNVITLVADTICIWLVVRWAVVA